MSRDTPLAVRLAGLGFDAGRLGFAARTALAACLALLAGWLMGLDHPQWSAMTVWAASQPTRGMLIEKAFFRAAGTLVGVAAGIVLVLLTDGTPGSLVLGLTAWVALCALAGNLLRGFVAYGTLLAGYSACMVALLDTPHPANILHLGADRCLTVLTGVAVAVLAGLFFAPAETGERTRAEVRRLTARLLREMAGHLRGAPALAAEAVRRMLGDLAALEDTLDPQGAGSVRSRRSAKALRAIIIADVALLMGLRDTLGPDSGNAAGALEEAAAALDDARPQDAGAALARAATAAGDSLADALARLAAALRSHVAAPGAPDARAKHPVVLHRDWAGALRAMVRAAGTMGAVGALWVATGWAGAPYLLLGTSVMISLFSTFENPASMMRHVVIGQACGAGAALACRWLAWPLAANELQMVLMVMPFILLGSLPLAHRHTMLGAYDYNLVMLLLLQPAFPLSGTLPHSLEMAACVVAGALVALVSFRLVFPADAARRRAHLVAMMVRELRAMAANPAAAARRGVWRARLFHRTLRLARWSDRAGDPSPAAAQAGLALLRIAQAVMAAHALRGTVPAGTARGIDLMLKRMQRLSRDPEKLARALGALSRRLRAAHPQDAAVMDEAADAVQGSWKVLRAA